MRLADRVTTLELARRKQDAYRLLVIPDGADAEAARTEFRQRTGYRGLLMVLTETDARL